MADRFKVGDEVALTGQTGSKLVVVAARDVMGNYTLETSFGTKVKKGGAHLVPYGESTGTDTGLKSGEGRRNMNEKGVPWTHRRF